MTVLLMVMPFVIEYVDRVSQSFLSGCVFFTFSLLFFSHSFDLIMNPGI